ncbi:MAG TPA: MltA domain-containing protein [Burkholderiaceae bacterium]|nr:MltA domain-containing protein [Burkholderiaceae bacterium]
MQVKQFSNFFLNLVVAAFLGACSTPLTEFGTDRFHKNADENIRLPSVIVQVNSRWVPIQWHELPGWAESSKLGVSGAWKAWLKSCEVPATAMANLCADIRRHGLSTSEAQIAWMKEKLQPYRVESLNGQSEGLLTSYFEPEIIASRILRPGFTVPLYRPPANLGARIPWHTRQEIDSLPLARAKLRGHEIAYVANPIDAMILQIQGSGRLNIIEADGTQRTIRLAYAANNEHPYRSIGRWLLEQGERGSRDITWKGIKDWQARNQHRTNELLWSNPRVVFFHEELLKDMAGGPRGAQGVSLTPEHSIAVDRHSIPYGAPVWLVSNGSVGRIQKIVIAQDTGSAITGAVRADYFAGWGNEAGEYANRVKQNLRMWVLWTK